MTVKIGPDGISGPCEHEHRLIACVECQEDLRPLRHHLFSNCVVETQEQAEKRFIMMLCDIETRSMRQNPRHRRKSYTHIENFAWTYCHKAFYGCFFCGESDPSCLDFHHRRGLVKTAAISQMIPKQGLLAIMAEAQKCIVTCSNCHRKTHHRERNGLPGLAPFVAYANRDLRRARA